MFTLLYVDDEPGLLEIGKIFLEQGGQFSVKTVTSSFQALEMLQAGKYDAIISDYQMPEMDGIEFLKRVRSSGNTIPFIIFTGRGREEIVIQALNEGADFYLQKGGEPVSQFAELAHKIRQAVQQRRTEASVRDHERREADIINFLPDATFAIDTTGVVIAWNQAMEMMTGVSSSQILGKGNHEYSLPFYGKRRPILIDLILTYDDSVARLYDMIHREGCKLFSEVFVPSMNGRHGLYLWFTASPLFNRDGTVIGAIESIRDITERKKTERALRESEQRYRNVVEDQTEFICRFLPDGTHVFVNDAYCRYFQKKRDEIIGHHFEPQLLKEDQKKVRALITSLTPDNPVGFVRQRVIFPDRSVRWQRWVDRAIFDEKGAIQEYQSVGRDITDVMKAELALEESEQRYRNVVEDQTEFICRFRPDGTHVFVNDAYCRYFGLERGEIVGHRFRPEIPSEDQKNMSRFFAALTPDHPVDTIVHRIVMPDGSIRWQRWSDRALFDPSGKVIEYQSVGRDVTETKEAEAALRESEQRYRNIIEDQTEFICRFRPDGTHVFVNDAYCRYFGLERGKIVGHRFRPEIPSEDQKSMSRFFAALTPDHPVDTIEHRIVMPDGGIRWQRWSDRAIFDPSGKIIEYQSVGRDITENKETEISLQGSEDRFRRLLSGSSDAIIMHEDGRIVLANDSAARIIGVPSKGILTGRPVLDLVHPEFRAKEAGRIQHVLESTEGIVPPIEETFVRANGTPIAVEITTTATQYEGRPALMTVFRDISDRNTREETLCRPGRQDPGVVHAAGKAVQVSGLNQGITDPEQVGEAIRESNRKLDLLISITRHDVSNQLAVIHGYTQLAALGKPGQATTDFLARIASSIETIRHQLAFMKEYQELGVQAPAWFRIGDVIRGVRPENITVVCTCDSCEIFADPMISRVFFNLFDNAMKYGERVTAVTAGCEKRDEGLVVTFADNGIGIPQDEKLKIFTKGYGKNTGHGLFLSREILAITGISIRETGSHGEGARFELTVPKGTFRFAS